MLNRSVIRTLSLLLAASSLFAAGSVTQSLQQLGGGETWVVVFHARGDATDGSVPITKAAIGSVGNLQGFYVTSSEIVPLSPAPTAGYSVQIRDQAGVDVLSGNASSLSATLPQAFSASLSLPPINGTFTLNATGTTVAGARFDVYVYLTAPLALIGAGSAGSPGTPGAAGTNGLSILNGSGVPSSGLGVNGDFYLDTSTSRLYGPKSAGVWGSGVSLIGATGATGAAGTNGLSILNGSGAPSGGTGVNGDFYIDTSSSTLYGPKAGGVWGSGTSLIGPTGPAGTFPIVLGPLQFLQGTPNVSSPAYEASDLPYFLVSDFDFPTVTPGGSLTGGVAASVTLTPCPLGVDGSDASHNYYISAGTGTAEAVLGTGGTCTSGASSGTILFTPANNHGGAWTFKSDSGGLRETILYSGGHSTIVLDANTTILTSASDGVVVDKDNLTLVGAGHWTSIIKPRDNAQANQVLYASACNYCKFLNFAIDGNRANGGTNASFGTGLGMGVVGVGGASHTVVHGLEIKNSNYSGIILTDTNVDVEFSGNWIHNNGGVVNGSGTGQGIFVWWSSALREKADNIRIVGNTITDNHNTITNAGPSSAIATQASNVLIANNFIKNNYNNGGQVVIASGPGPVGPALIENNTIIYTASGLSETTSGIESDSYRVTIKGNTITGHTTGSSIALEGNPGSPGGIGASDNVIDGNNISGTNNGGIGLNNGGGITRGTVVNANRIAVSGGAGLFLDTATLITTVTANNFSDTDTPIVDSSSVGAITFGNWPPTANFAYGGTIPSAATINMRCNQTATISGVAAITSIVLPANSFGGGAQGLGQGCTVTLIPTGIWTTSGANFTLGSTAVVGKALILTYNGSKWAPVYQ